MPCVMANASEYTQKLLGEILYQQQIPCNVQLSTSQVPLSNTTLMGQTRLWSLPLFGNINNNLCHDCGQKQTSVTLLTQYGVKVGELIKSTDEHFSIKWMILNRSLRFAEWFFGDSLPKIAKLMGWLKPNTKSSGFKLYSLSCRYQPAWLSGTNHQPALSTY